MAEYAQDPATLNLAVKAGDELNADLTITVGCSGTAAFSLAGYTIDSDLRSLVSGNVVQTVTASITNAPAGIVNISMTEAETADLPTGSYSWRLRWTTPNDITRTVYAGILEVRR
jgi:hypothetical protein